MRQGLAANEIGDLDAPANPDAVDRLHFGQLRSLLRMLVLFSPVLILSYLGWRHRWIADDAFINFRIVKQLEAGHGPVFNIGTRVESGTSPLWLAVLAIFDAITPVPIEWIAVFVSLLATVGGLTFAVLGTRRALLHAGLSRPTLIPLGALVYAALPPAWDYATSGLEVGISLLWLGASWWLLTGRLDVAEGKRRAAWKPWWVPVVLGLGPLVRPDFLVFSAFFLVAFVLLAEDRRRLTAIIAVVGLAEALPVATELFRMGYYGILVPNTALAKEGALSDWHRGWNYLTDLIAPHVLLVPILVLVAAYFVPLLRSRSATRLRLLFGLTIAAALTHCLYVVRVGGDYMHGRMLLPALFVLLLPVSVVAVRTWQWIAVGVVVVWATASAFVLRPAYSGSLPGGVTAPATSAISNTTGISDERLVQIRLTWELHPVTLKDFAAHNAWANFGLTARRMFDSGERGLLLEAPNSPDAASLVLVPLRHGVRARLVIFTGAVGVLSYAAGDSVDVVDPFGIVDAVASHQRLVARGRAGHDKSLPVAWVFAQYTDPGTAIPWTFRSQTSTLGNDGPLLPADLEAARHAITCGDFPELQASTRGSLTLGRIVKNIAGSLEMYRFRFNPDPQRAEVDLCGR